MKDLNTLRPRQNGRHFADDIFKCIFLNENVWIPIKISLKFVPQGPINNIPALVQIMAWRRSGDKPLSEPMMVGLLTHICVTRPQWVNSLAPGRFKVNFRWVIFKLILVVNGFKISCETALIWVSLDHAYDKSTLVQVISWCRQATSITWANVDPDLCHHMASLGHNELRYCCYCINGEQCNCINSLWPYGVLVLDMGRHLVGKWLADSWHGTIIRTKLCHHKIEILNDNILALIKYRDFHLQLQSLFPEANQWVKPCKAEIHSGWKNK